MVSWLLGWAACWFHGLLVCFVCLSFSGIFCGNAWDYVEVLQINQRIYLFRHVPIISRGYGNTGYDISLYKYIYIYIYAEAVVNQLTSLAGPPQCL